MAGYNKYPGLDDDLNFPPAVLQKIADSPQIEEKIANSPGGGSGSGVVILGILNAGQAPPSAGVWARRLPQ